MVTGRTIAVIPARGGSKRIPRKNVVDFFGKPMIAWTIEAAAECALFDSVIVSTDDEEIADVSRRFGAAVPFLREAHCDDNAPISLATISALDQMKQHGAGEFDIVVQLMPNCPLRRAGDIKAAVDRFRASRASFQISCVRFGWMNPWWAASLDAEGHPRALFPDARMRRSQDLEPLYCPTGAVWIAGTTALRAAKTFYGEGHVFFPLDWKAGVDIDDAQDLDMAKAAFAMMERAPKALHG